MSSNSIFFSYSRDNSDFVLNLAKELREAGATVWLDQLDIKPGTRWDKSIETALAESSTLLVVLSKSSVASNNVMDEVSYALEEGKTVVPVLLEECEIPFRLRRLQFADFTKSHKTGVETLSRALHLDADTTSKLVDEAPSSPPPVEKAKAAPAVEKEQAAAMPPPATPAKKSKSKMPLYAIGGIVVLLAALYFSGVFTGEGKDMMALCKADWEELEKAESSGEEVNQLAALRRHIELYAPCPHENDAMDRISFLNAMGEPTDEVATENNDKTTENNERSSDGNTNSIDPEDVTSTQPPAINNETLNEGTPEEPAANDNSDFTGLNVKVVEFGQGHFKQVVGKNWVESNDGNKRSFKLISRDKDEIILGDGPDVRLRLSITDFKIYYTDVNNPEFLLYTIIDVK